jgi:DNA invertase Pin-like site-specific DNA recombinase
MQQPGDLLAVPKFDRLSRSLADFAALIARAQREGWVLACLDPEIDLSTATGVAFAQMLGVFAEFKRRQYIDRMRGGKRAKRDAGGYIGGSRLARRFGYELAQLADGKLEYQPMPPEQAIIGDMRERYEAGETLEKIAASLSGRVETTTGGERWSRQAVAAILRREGVDIRSRGRKAAA